MKTNLLAAAFAIFVSSGVPAGIVSKAIYPPDPDPGRSLLEWFRAKWAPIPHRTPEQTAQAVLLLDAETRRAILKTVEQAPPDPYQKQLLGRLRGLLLEDEGKFDAARKAYESIGSAPDQVRLLWRTGHAKDAAALMETLGDARADTARIASSRWWPPHRKRMLIRSGIFSCVVSGPTTSPLCVAALDCPKTGPAIRCTNSNSTCCATTTSKPTSSSAPTGTTRNSSPDILPWQHGTTG